MPMSCGFPKTGGLSGLAVVALLASGALAAQDEAPGRGAIAEAAETEQNAAGQMPSELLLLPAIQKKNTGGKGISGYYDVKSNTKLEARIRGEAVVPNGCETTGGAINYLLASPGAGPGGGPKVDRIIAGTETDGSERADKGRHFDQAVLTVRIQPVSDRQRAASQSSPQSSAALSAACDSAAKALERINADPGLLSAFRDAADRADGGKLRQMLTDAGIDNSLVAQAHIYAVSSGVSSPGMGLISGKSAIQPGVQYHAVNTKGTGAQNNRLTSPGNALAQGVGLMSGSAILVIGTTPDASPSADIAGRGSQKAFIQYMAINEKGVPKK